MVDVPERILANWREWYGAEAEAFAAGMRERLAAAAEEWDLREPRALEGGEVALVVEAIRDGSPVVCKLNPADPNLDGEAAALAAWSGICPELLAFRDEGRTMLMERLDPGGTLLAAGASVDDQLRVIGGLANRLHHAEAPDVPRLAESEMAREWMEALDADDRAELRELLEGGDVVIHTDLHADNVLDHGGSWRVIDPKPFRAMPEAEIWGVIDETDLQRGEEHEEMRRRLGIYCDAAAMDPDLARRWARLRALAEAGGLTERQAEWKRELRRVAAALEAGV